MVARAGWPKAILAAYEQVLPRVNTHAELLDLLNEISGELGASHAGAFGPQIMAFRSPSLDLIMATAAQPEAGPRPGPTS